MKAWGDHLGIGDEVVVIVRGNGNTQFSANDTGAFVFAQTLRHGYR